jgi:hypothetical protein
MRYIILIAVIVLGSCNPLCGCSPEPYGAVLAGSLRSAADVPLGGYRVRPELAPVAGSGCEAFASAGVQAVTPSDGSFRLRMDGGGAESLCVRFFARDTTTGAAEQGLMEVLRIRTGPFPFDTIAVTLRLTP